MMYNKGQARTLVLALWAFCRVQTAWAQEQEEGPVDLPASTNSTKHDAAASPSNYGWGDVYEGKIAETTGASAGGEAGTWRLYGGFRLDVGGGFTLWDNDDFLVRAAVTPALQAGVDHVMWRYFALGGETRLNWVRARGAEQRVLLWDLVLQPRIRNVAARGRLEYYGALPVGLTVANFPNDTPFKTSGKAHATLGFRGGINYFFRPHWGLNVAVGWLWHWIRAEYGDHDGDPNTPRLGVRTQRLGQFALLDLNVVYAF